MVACRRVLRHGLLVLLAMLVGAATVPGPAASAQGEPLVWSRVGGVDGVVILEDVFMVRHDLAWAAGRLTDDSQGYVYRLRLVNGLWRAERDGQLPAGVYAISALGAENLWAVGAGGLIARRDAGGWHIVQSPTPGRQLRGIQMLGDGREGWAGGERTGRSAGGRAPLMMRFRDGRWEEAPIEATPGDDSYISALHLGSGAGWAVGNGIWRLQGDEWRREEFPQSCDAGCVGWLNAVRAVNGEQAVAVGERSGTCAICTGKIFVAERDRNGWRAPFYSGWPAETLPPPPVYPETHSMGALYLTDGQNGLAVGTRSYGTTRDGPQANEIFGLRYTGGAWRYEQILPGYGLPVTGLFMIDATHALLVGPAGLIVSYGYGDQSATMFDPAARVPNPNQPGVAYFPETGHTLRGAFRRVWERNGGLAQFGYPLTEEYAEVSETDGNTYTVQYFERARFELHPEHAGTPYEVLLGLLGNTLTAHRKEEAPFLRAAANGQPGAVYFRETGHNMAPEFVEYWRRNGGLAIYGYPISEPFREVNAADGRSYLVQYFERNRFEHHPELAGTRYEVLLGLLGSEVLARKR